jgi:hypothetical protein
MAVAAVARAAADVGLDAGDVVVGSERALDGVGVRQSGGGAGGAAGRRGVNGGRIREAEGGGLGDPLHRVEVEREGVEDVLRHHRTGDEGQVPIGRGRGPGSLDPAVARLDARLDAGFSAACRLGGVPLLPRIVEVAHVNVSRGSSLSWVLRYGREPRLGVTRAGRDRRRAAGGAAPHGAGGVPFAGLTGTTGSVERTTMTTTS